MEARRAIALDNNRQEYAKKLRHAISALEAEGMALGVQIAHKRKNIVAREYEEAKTRKEEIERRREEIYQ